MSENSKIRPDVALLLQSDPLLEGGVARVVRNLANGFAHEGLGVDLVTTGSVRTIPEDLDSRVRLIQLGSPGLKAAFIPIVRYLRRVRPKAMLSSMDHLNILAVWARALSRVETRLVISTHGALTPRLRELWGWREKTLLPPLLALSYPLADKVVGVSGGVAGDLHQFIPGASVHRIYNPIFTKGWERVPEVDSTPRELEGDIPVVLGAGRFTEEKDFSLLLDAFSLAKQAKDLRLVILGDGKLQGELRLRAESLGIQGDTFFPGMLADPSPYFRKASVFVLSSRWEGFGNVLVEALACGTPVVSTDCPFGPAEILADGVYGILTPVGDTEAMAAGILRALASPPDPDFLKARAREFSVEASVREYRKVLNI